MPKFRQGPRWAVRLAVWLALSTAWFMPVAAARAAPARAAVVALALWSDPVFRSEADGAAKVLARRYGHGGPVIVRANTAAALVNGPAGIAAALKAAERGMDPGHDVLFLVLTSHGGAGGGSRSEAAAAKASFRRTSSPRSSPRARSA